MNQLAKFVAVDFRVCFCFVFVILHTQKHDILRSSGHVHDVYSVYLNENAVLSYILGKPFRIFDLI